MGKRNRKQTIFTEGTLIYKDLLMAVLETQVREAEIDIKIAARQGRYQDAIRAQGKKAAMELLALRVLHNDLVSLCSERQRKKYDLSIPPLRSVGDLVGDLPPPRGFNKWLSPALCNHANECPTSICDCPPNCSCRQRMCPQIRNH